MSKIAIPLLLGTVMMIVVSGSDPLTNTKVKSRRYKHDSQHPNEREKLGEVDKLVHKIQDTHPFGLEHHEKQKFRQEIFDIRQAKNLHHPRKGWFGTHKWFKPYILDRSPPFVSYK